MSKRRYIKASEEDFTIIKRADLRRRHIDNGTLYFLYNAICFMEYRFIGNNSDWFASIDDIAEEAMEGRDSVIRGIKVLEEMGLLRVIRQKYSKETGKRSSTNRYKILGSTMNQGDEEEGSKCEEQASPKQENKPQAAAEKPRAKKLKEQPAQVNKAIESQPEVKDETPHIINSGVDDKRASKIIFNLYGFGMKESEWLRALGSRSRRQINLCRGPYMANLSKDERDYLDDYIDNILKVA